MKRALIAGTVYFLMVFALGFVLGTVRVVIVAPRLGQFAATLAEAPMMLITAFFACRWTVRRWQLPRTISIRWAMTLWFLGLLWLFEVLLGVALFGRTLSEQLAAVATPAGMVGLSAQILTALLLMVVGRGRPS